jgi:hypothetical protein
MGAERGPATVQSEKPAHFRAVPAAQETAVTRENADLGVTVDPIEALVGSVCRIVKRVGAVVGQFVRTSGFSRPVRSG